MNIIALITLSVCSLLWIGLAVYLLASWMFFTPYYPSRKAGLIKVLNELNLPSSSHQTFIDVGSGDGKIVRLASKLGFKSFGIELNPYLSLLSKILNKLFRIKNTKIIQGSFFKHDFHNYDVVYLYIFSEYMNKLKDKLFKDLKSGSIIVSNTFQFNNVEPDKIIDRYYIYIIK
jgi:SAM-dependent methyltransferase